MRNSTRSSKRSPRDFAKLRRKGLLAQLLRRVDQQIAGLERRRRFLMTADRKREAREKFLLGGIVVRAGLLKADRAFLLGGLLERDIGEEAFKTGAQDCGLPRIVETVE